MKTAVWVLGGVLAAAGAVWAWDAYHHAGRVLPGVWVDGYPAGGIPPAQLRGQLWAWAHRRLRRPLVVHAGGRRWTLQARQAGLQVHVDEAVERAYQVGRHPDWSRRLRERWALQREGVAVRVGVSVDASRLRALVGTLAKAVDVAPRDAQLVVVGGQVRVVPGRQGVGLDVRASEALLRAALLRGDAEVTLPVRVVPPRWTEQQLVRLGISHRVASFTTRLAPDPDRVHNVRLAASRLRGLLLPTGFELSFNRAVGPRTRQAGFREAPVLVDEELVPGDGGGVCQVSSTLFNAALLADLVVTARRNHTQPVPYVPLGRDATVVYGWLDLRVRNDGPPLLLWTELSPDRLTVSFYGRPRPARWVRVRVVQVEVLPPPPGEVVRQDPRLPAGTLRALPARPGYRATTVREVWEGGRLVREEVVARSAYRPVPRTVKVGTGQAAGNARWRAARP